MFKFPDGVKVDIDAANRRFRFCVEPSKVSDRVPKGIPQECTPWISFDDALDELRRAGVNTREEGKRFWKRLKGWFGQD